MGFPIVHVEISVSDLERAKHFYGEAFGWTFQDWARASTPYALFQTGPDGIGGALEQVAVPRPGGGVTLYVEVPDVEAGVRRALACGGVLTMPPVQVSPEVGWCAAVDDPDGNRIGLYQRAARAKPKRRRTEVWRAAERGRGRRKA